MQSWYLGACNNRISYSSICVLCIFRMCVHIVQFHNKNTAGKVFGISQKLAAAGSCPGWFYNIYRNRTSAVGKNSFRTSRQHIFNICSSSLLGDIYICSIRTYVMAWQKRERSNKILQRHFRNMGGQFFYIGTFSAGIYLQRSLVIFKYAEFERNRLQIN